MKLKILAMLILVSLVLISCGGEGNWTDGYNAGTHDGNQAGYSNGYRDGQATAVARSQAAAAAAATHAQATATASYTQGQNDAKGANYDQGRKDMYHTIQDWLNKNCHEDTSSGTIKDVCDWDPRMNIPLP